MTDIQIAQSSKMKKITAIAKKLGIDKSKLELYGDYKAKINDTPNENLQGKKLVLVTAINPTPAGEGKTTVSIGLADGLNLIGKRTCLALREPSLGPVFGIKGGATGGGYSQILPMDDINLHFTGDFHAITSANNLLCALIDNSVFQGNPLNIDTDKIVFNRTMDMNDRALRGVQVNYNVKDATPRFDKFNITSACEVMAILSLSRDLDDLKQRLGNILVAYSNSGKPIYARDLHAQDAMAILLKDALKPNLVQSIGGTPALVHCGPFANIAHGCNSVVATKLAMSYADYTVTEAGFGADLGAEKFLDVKCRIANLQPDAVVVVATIRALKMHGGLDKNNLTHEDLDALQKGMPNLIRHVNNIKNVYHLPVVVAINKFTTDTQQEVDTIINAVQSQCDVKAVPCNVWAKGGKGATELAQSVVELCEQQDNAQQFTFAYQDSDDIKTKVQNVATKIYGASGVNWTDKALNSLSRLVELGCDNLPVIIAKTQYSFSDNAKLLGAPQNFEITIKDIEPRLGAGFVVAIAGSMLLMPGLSKQPSAVNMTIDNEGNIEGLF